MSLISYNISLFNVTASIHLNLTCSFDRFSTRYGHFPESLRLEMLSESRKMFEFGYNCYMKCAFPQDELDPGWFF